VGFCPLLEDWGEGLTMRKMALLRDRAMLTQAGLARAAGGVKGSQIDSYEQGKAVPTRKTLRRIAAVLGVEAGREYELLVEATGADIKRVNAESAQEHERVRERARAKGAMLMLTRKNAIRERVELRRKVYSERHGAFLHVSKHVRDCAKREAKACRMPLYEWVNTALLAAMGDGA
jgi:transcriptional regulator with XRE-family HTH domain